MSRFDAALAVAHPERGWCEVNSWYARVRGLEKVGIGEELKKGARIEGRDWGVGAKEEMVKGGMWLRLKVVM